MRPRAVLVVLLLLAAAPPVLVADDRVELDAWPTIQGLRTTDVNGDGLTDLLLVEGRRLQLFFGRRGRLPAAAPSWSRTLPRDVSFVDILPALEGRTPALLTLGTRGAGRLSLSPGAAIEALPDGDPLSWFDARCVTFADLVRGEGGLLLPRRDGWTYLPPGKAGPIRLDMPRSRFVKAPGPFLEDTCQLVIGLPGVYVGAPPQAGHPRGAQALWALTGRVLRAHTAAGDVVYDLGFLRADDPQQKVVQRLLDLDGDRRPELMHRISNNREVRYGFFHTRPAEAATARGPSHQPAASDVYLAGFALPPRIVDLDGDGLPDLVATSIQIDAANTLRALSSGKVTAETHAFLNRWRDGKGRYFLPEADATIESDIGVQVQVDYTGVLKVERSYTILATGDFDGDGRKDLAIRTDDRSLTVRRGTADGVWEKRGRTMPIPPLGASPDASGYTADLDGDGRDEVILSYSKPPGGRDRLWILRVGP